MTWRPGEILLTCLVVALVMGGVLLFVWLIVRGLMG